MDTIVIFLAQLKTTAIIAIILLLLISGIIGYVTAWLYYRSVYTKIINKLESEKEDLNKQIGKLNEDNNKLKSSLNKKDEEIENLKSEIDKLKGTEKNK